MGTGSLAETIAATIVETLLALLVASAVVATLATATAAADRARELAELARFELVLVDACGRVLQPPDSGGPVVVATPQGSSPRAGARRIEIGSLDGEREKRLVVVADGEKVRVSVAGVEHRFEPLRVERMEVERTPVGHLSLTVRAGRSGRHEVRAPFGSFAPL